MEHEDTGQKTDESSQETPVMINSDTFDRERLLVIATTQLVILEASAQMITQPMPGHEKYGCLCWQVTWHPHEIAVPCAVRGAVLSLEILLSKIKKELLTTGFDRAEFHATVLDACAPLCHQLEALRGLRDEMKQEQSYALMNDMIRRIELITLGWMLVSKPDQAIPVSLLGRLRSSSTLNAFLYVASVWAIYIKDRNEEE